MARRWQHGSPSSAAQPALTMLGLVCCFAMATAMRGGSSDPGIPPPDCRVDARLPAALQVGAAHVLANGTCNAPPDVIPSASYYFHYMHTTRETTLLRLRSDVGDRLRGDVSYRSTTKGWSGFHGRWVFNPQPLSLVIDFRWNALLPLHRHRFQKVADSQCTIFRDVDLLRDIVDVDCGPGPNGVQWR